MKYSKVYCIDCRRLLGNRAKYYKSKRCRSCSKSGVNSVFYGKNLSSEHIKNISNSHKGKKHSLKTKNKISLSIIKLFKNPKNTPMYGKKHSFKIKEIISLKAKKRFMNPKNNPMYGKKHSYETKKQFSLIHGGTGIPYENTEYGPEFDSALKEQIRFRDKYKCQECGCSQLENGRQLDIHHIDYDKKNNILCNLISLCMKCHRKTNFNRKYWIKHFKEIISIIYKIIKILT